MASALRVLGIDPGLTRCGVGVVDVRPDRSATLVHVGVVRSSPDQAPGERLALIAAGLRGILAEHRPDVVAVERVFAASRPDLVCHQAAQMSVSRSVREPLFDARVNCLGLINVLDAAVRQGCGRFVFASSGGVLYGDVTAPAPETAPADPVSPYGITKWVGERYLKFYAAEHGLTYVPPYNDPDVVAGQGTVAVETLEQLAGAPLDAIVVAVGGGGLISGIAAVLKAHLPEISVYGAQPARDDAMAASVRAGQITMVDAGPTLSDGTAGSVEPGSRRMATSST